ncbi:N-acetyl-D-Glu racemase DgcA [Pararhodospirillum oryzae]|uniref:Dipeptide epimerase n=1 Tax=Pararhodospirillum oryzae TaxID=478448 RepID=A0A512H573_9PROT|nr:N-acetyl-D-Glu racemase DgcA [Pararhodospirillum oryzae]GEO80510.1 dipeptide epimerase [Pararhodospirillum oryzae]
MTGSSPSLRVRAEVWPVAGTFVIARDARTEVHVVVAEITQTTPDGRLVVGRGECVPYRRYGETVAQVMTDLEGMAPAVAGGLTRQALLEALPAGAARNALDCALLDLEAKREGRPAWAILGLAPPRPTVTAQTLSLDTPEKMEERARALADRPLLKIKVGGSDPVAQVAAVRRGAPEARLIVDANESWADDRVRAFVTAMADLDVDLIEQPVPAGRDEALEGLRHLVPLCADESVHGLEDMERLAAYYTHINIKLDKTGGLTAALNLARAAEDRAMGLMIGCMLATSLAMAPALLLAARAEFVDLDGPLLLARDREHGLSYEGTTLYPATPALWG